MLQQSIVIHILKSIITFKLCHVIKTLIITLQTSLLVPVKLLKYYSIQSYKACTQQRPRTLNKAAKFTNAYV